MCRRLMIAAGAALGFLALTVLVVLRAAPVIHLDVAVNSAAVRAALAHPAWRALLVAVTNTGGPTVVTVAASVAVIVLLVLRRVRDALSVAAAVLGPVLLRLIVLAVIARPRPPLLLAPAAGWSYPSGHTTASAAAALAVILAAWPRLPRPWQRRALAGIAGGWAIAVGISRVALAVHWPTDVVAAWLFTAAVALPLSLAAPRATEPQTSPPSRPTCP